MLSSTGLESDLVSNLWDISDYSFQGFKSLLALVVEKLSCDWNIQAIGYICEETNRKLSMSFLTS